MRARGGYGRAARAPGQVRRAALTLATLATISSMLGGIAGATTTTELNARAASITAALDQANVELATIGERYLAAKSAQSLASAQAIGDRVAIGHLDTALVGRRRALVHAAVAAYVNGGTDALSALLGSSAGELAAASTYLRVASNRLSSAIVALRDLRRRRDLELDSAHVALAGAQRDASLALSERGAALSELGREHALLSSVRGQLAVIVTAQRAAAARAAAAAAARAAAAAAAAAAAVQHISPTSSSSSISGPPSAVPHVPASPIPSGSLEQAFAGIRDCESGGVYTLDTGNGYYGAYQFAQQTWLDLGETGLPSAAPPATQDAAAYELYRSSGFASWPECAAILGL